MEEYINCHLCGTRSEKLENFNSTPSSASGFIDGDTIFSGISCPICQQYYISLAVLTKYFPNNISTEDKSRLSGYFRESWEYTEPTMRSKDPYLSQIMLTTSRVQQLLASSDLPKKGDIEKKFYKFLKLLNMKTQFYGQGHHIHYSNDYPVAYAQNMYEFHRILLTLKDAGEITGDVYSDGAIVSITLQGIQTIKESNVGSKQIFVALAFDSEIKKSIESIRSAVKEQTGYELLTIDRKEHNNDIPDEIIAEINRSRAVVADFTNNNRGAYYEAGYAHGIGLEVIFVCKDEVDDKGNQLIDAIHFDLNHRNHIIWKDINDLTCQLINRINATINRPK